MVVKVLVVFMAGHRQGRGRSHIRRDPDRGPSRIHRGLDRGPSRIHRGLDLDRSRILPDLGLDPNHTRRDRRPGHHRVPDRIRQGHRPDHPRAQAPDRIRRDHRLLHPRRRAGGVAAGTWIQSPRP
ncbi:hypothetical protein SAMN05192564_104376 [Paraburkholderia sartisoli]|uniref:Uncharacterized protein n=1 Tax=Paraburkholderia sartisoli TaxID=83784 RepID=A0A1H4FH04_9BURK|nr:hypothetical protein SAMN05192564_104376 [Paraburkholderia sartisoli]